MDMDKCDKLIMLYTCLNEDFQNKLLSDAFQLLKLQALEDAEKTPINLEEYRKHKRHRN